MLMVHCIILLALVYNTTLIVFGILFNNYWNSQHYIFFKYNKRRVWRYQRDNQNS